MQQLIQLLERHAKRVVPCRASRHAALVLALTASVAGATGAQDRVWTQTGEPVPGWEAVDSSVRAFMQNKDVPGAVLAVSFEGRLIFAHGYTWDSADVEPVRPTSLFRIASLSKPITSVAIHQLIERGELDYDTRIVDVLDLQPPPGWARDPRLEQVTVDQLLCHTGGWDQALSFDPMFRDEAIAAALRVALPISKYDIATYMTGSPLQFAPGTRFAYSNYGYALLGMLIEKITGRDYSEWVAENVFQPIGVGRPRRGHTAAAERAPGEVRYYGRPAEDPYRWNIENMDAHGGWILSAPDYLRFMDALFDDPGASALLARASLESMLEVNPLSGDWEYARGWGVSDAGGQPMYHHGGSLPGTLTTAKWVGGLGIVALINTSRDVGGLEVGQPGDLPRHDLFDLVGIVASALGAAGTESWIPVVAHTGGVGGSFWRSDVGLLNRSPLANDVRLRCERQGIAADHDVRLAPGEHVTVGDVVSVVGLAGSCSLRVLSSEPLTVTSRTYTTDANGTFGQFLGGVTGAGGLRKGGAAVLMHLREDHAARSNIGILNAGRRQARVRVDLFDGTGAAVAGFTQAIGARQVEQLNRPFSVRGGRSDVTEGYAVVTVLEGEEVVGYGSVVDALTNDPTTVPMQTGSGMTSAWIAAAAHVAGVAGSVWRTDLGLLNRGASPAQVSVTLHRPGTPGLVTTLVLDAGHHRVLRDVVGLMGASGSGFLEISSDRPIMASSRTFNQSSSGTFGQYFAAMADKEATGRGSSLWLPQLKQTLEYRTNVGLVNVGSARGEIVLHLHGAEGRELAAAGITLAPGERVQLQEPFKRIARRADIDNGYAVVEVQSGSGILAYASVIDNRTNDPTTIPMAR